MIPILYEGSEKEFLTQGIGSLTDATSCKISEEINNTYELEMNYPMTGVHFSDIQVGRIILAQPAPKKETEPFSIYKISKPMNGIVTIYAEHISYRLSFIPVKPFNASTCIEALNGCVDNSLETNPFNVWTDKELNIEFSFNIPQSFRTCLGGVEGSILDIYRGEYEFNRFTVKLYTNRGSLKDTAKIIYGKNLTDLKQDESIENTVTGIVPYWKSTVTQTDDEASTTESVEVIVTLSEYVLESEYADKYPYRRTSVVDLSEYFETQPTEDELRTRAEQYMKDNLTGLPTVSLDVSFIDLARSEENKNFASEIVYLGDKVPVYFEKLGISTKAEITSITYDVLADRYDSLTLGTVSSSLSKTISDISKEQETVITQSKLETALILAQKVMAGGTGGYIITKYFDGHPSEMYFGDADNVDAMVNCIRINKNGIAFSNSGISGPYVSAWTIDGKFNADFIQTGELDGGLIKANTIQVGQLSEDVQSDITTAKEQAQEANSSINGIKSDVANINNSINTLEQTTDQLQSDVSNAQSSADSASDLAKQAQEEALESTQKAEEANALAQSTYNGLNDLEQVVQIDSTGVKVLESANSKNFSQIKSDGMHVFNIGEDVAQFGQQSKMNNLAVKDFLMFGAHRAELLTVDGVQGTAFYWIGDVE